MEIHNNDEVFHIKLAKEDDLQIVLDLVVNAAEWLQSKNTTQWEYYLTNLEENTPEIFDSIHNTYILMKDNIPVASVTLETSPNEWDRDIWGDEANEEGVIYLHRLVVHRNYAGVGLGTKLLEWSERFCAEKGNKAIRFDCLASNKGLNDFYQRRYKLKDIANIYGQHSKYEVML
ncbi:GNAT family N-acetyltransferase [Bacillus carboniphilus]|uniref:GNAT family N-acetyltransferase n=1 Tax=Bacillus carboniphilus TaxID=86663 RepID=A0ABN0W376_9BACI